MSRLVAAALAAVLVVLMVATGTATATTANRARTVTDPDDVISTLDLHRVRLQADGERIVARFTTYDRVAADDLDGANGLHLRFGVGRRTYREVLIQSLSGRWTGTICTGRVGRLTIDRDCAVLRTRRASDRSWRVVIPRRLIDRGARTYRWNAWSEVAIQTAGCTGAGPCDDYIAPEGTYLRWRAPRPSPAS